LIRARLAGVFNSRSSRIFALIAIVDSVGTGVYLAGSTIFCIRFIGLTPTQVGFGMTIAGVVGVVATVPLGKLGSHVGPKRMLVIVQVWRAIWFVLLAFAWDLVSFTVIICANAVGEAAIPPLNQVVVAGVVGEHRRQRTLATLRTIRNVGFSVGALGATPLILADSSLGYRAIVLADAASFLLASALLSGVPTPITAVTIKRGSLKRLTRLRDWPYLRLAAVNAVLTFHTTILTLGIPIWLVQSTPAPIGLIAPLMMINTVMAVLLQIPLAGMAEKPLDAARTMRYAGVSLCFCCLLIAISGHANDIFAIACLILATVAVTFAELWQSAGAWELSYHYAIPDRQVEQLAIFNMGSMAQRVVGPLLITGLVIACGAWGWLGLVLLFVTTVGLVQPVVAALARQHDDSIISTTRPKESAC
jgi:MFS family permease